MPGPDRSTEDSHANAIQMSVDALRADGVNAQRFFEVAKFWLNYRLAYGPRKVFLFGKHYYWVRNIETKQLSLIREETRIEGMQALINAEPSPEEHTE